MEQDPAWERTRRRRRYLAVQAAAEPAKASDAELLSARVRPENRRVRQDRNPDKRGPLIVVTSDCRSCNQVPKPGVAGPIPAGGTRTLTNSPTYREVCQPTQFRTRSPTP